MTRNTKTFKLIVDNHELQADIGLYKDEIGVKQRLIISLEAWIEVNVSDLIKNNTPLDISQSQNYVRFIEIAEEILETRGHIDMVEEFSERFAKRILTETAVTKLKLKTIKPDVLSGNTHVGCEIERDKNDYLEAEKASLNIVSA